jgi:hypothetical protein
MGLRLMKKFLKIFVVIMVVISLSGCGITFTARKVYDKSEIYSKEEIREAMDVVFNEFSDFEGAVLLKLEYDEEFSNKQMKFNTGQYNCDETIVLRLKFLSLVKAEGKKWNIVKWDWILVRNEGENWEFKSCGYG